MKRREREKKHIFAIKRNPQKIARAAAIDLALQTKKINSKYGPIPVSFLFFVLSFYHSYIKYSFNLPI